MLTYIFRLFLFSVGLGFMLRDTWERFSSGHAIQLNLIVVLILIVATVFYIASVHQYDIDRTKLLGRRKD